LPDYVPYLREIGLPYFIRRPYAEVMALRQPKNPADEVDLLDLAKNVLSMETGPAVDGPFRLRRPLQPGDSGTMILELMVDEGTASVTISLAASNLIGPGSRIAAESVRISPSTISLSTGVPAEVTVTVQVPPDARPGLYTGALSATGDDTFAIGIQAEIL
jgi:hypothetical protein